jgi:hypothetical protein
MSSQYYSCKYLLTLKDCNGKLPDIYISDGNRTAGKSVAWKTLLVDRFLKGKDINQFILVFRNKYEMADCHSTFFTDIQRLFYQGHEMTSKKVAEGLIMEMFLDGETCGFACPLSMATKLKKLSPLFSRVGAMFFDEYQDESNRYLSGEVEKLMSLHTTVARGDGKQSRRVPLYMASNTVSMLNPYYNALGINKMLKSDTKFLRGDGWVMERTYNESAKKAFVEAGFNRAFKGSNYFAYASENVYLNDNNSLIEQPQGTAKYELSVKYNGYWYCCRRYDNMMYVDEGADMTYPVRICFNVDDVTDDRAVMVGRSHYMVITLRDWFSSGRMRFKNLKCKNMMLDLLSYM